MRSVEHLLLLFVLRGRLLGPAQYAWVVTWDWTTALRRWKSAFPGPACCTTNPSRDSDNLAPVAATAAIGVAGIVSAGVHAKESGIPGVASPFSVPTAALVPVLVPFPYPNLTHSSLA